MPSPPLAPKKLWQLQLLSSASCVLFMIITNFVLTSGLQVGYYEKICPHAEKIVKESMEGLLLSDVTAGAALVRLVFHDCDVNACDASILLQDDPKNGIESELHSPRNFGIRRLDFIEIIKEIVEHKCPGVVSCADVIVLAARDAIALLGGPAIPALTGRKDSLQAYRSLADSTIPPATASVEQVLETFSSKGITEEETVALLGSHTLGVSHCVSFENRLKPKLDKSMNPLLGAALEALCSGLTPYSNVTSAFNDKTNLVFDNQYFKDVLAHRGLLTADAGVASDPSTSPTVRRFASSQRAFFDAYTTAFLKLTQAAVLSDAQGQVRKRCSFVNN